MNPSIKTLAMIIVTIVGGITIGLFAPNIFDQASEVRQVDYLPDFSKEKPFAFEFHCDPDIEDCPNMNKEPILGLPITLKGIEKIENNLEKIKTNLDTLNQCLEMDNGTLCVGGFSYRPELTMWETCFTHEDTKLLPEGDMVCSTFSSKAEEHEFLTQYKIILMEQMLTEDLP